MRRNKSRFWNSLLFRCGDKIYLCRSKSLSNEQKHFRCSTYAKNVNDCLEHYIRKSVLTRIVISELDKLFTSLYEDNVSGKIFDERFEMMYKGYETEQADLKVKISELSTVIKVKEQKSADASQFLEIIWKYTEITELTPEIMHELIERIVVHSPDKWSGHKVQQIDIYYRFNIAVSTTIADRKEYSKKRKAAYNLLKIQ